MLSSELEYQRLHALGYFNLEKQTRLIFNALSMVNNHEYLDCNVLGVTLKHN